MGSKSLIFLKFSILAQFGLILKVTIVGRHLTLSALEAYILEGYSKNISVGSLSFEIKIKNIMEQIMGYLRIGISINARHAMLRTFLLNITRFLFPFLNNFNFYYTDLNHKQHYSKMDHHIVIYA